MVGHSVHFQVLSDRYHGGKILLYFRKWITYISSVLMDDAWFCSLKGKLSVQTVTPSAECICIYALQSLESQCQHPLAQLPPLHHRKNSKSPQRTKLACRGGLLNRQQSGPTIPRTLRSVLKRLCAAASDLLGNKFPISRPWSRCIDPHTSGNPVTVQYFLPVSTLFLSLPLSLWLCVGVLGGWAVSFHSSTNVWVLFSLLLLLLT